MTKAIVFLKKIEECPKIVSYPLCFSNRVSFPIYVRNSKNYIKYNEYAEGQKIVEITNPDKAIMLEIYNKNPEVINYTFFVGEKADRSWIENYITLIKSDVTTDIQFVDNPS